MSNLSDIGFPTNSDQEINEMIFHVLELAVPIRCERGFYLKFADASGAEIWLQGNLQQELISFNPYFAGKSRRKVGLTETIERDSSELDGGFYAWANPSDENGENGGDYPFVFDAPDFRLIEETDFPRIAEVQLTAFASNDFKIFADANAFDENQNGETKSAAKSFVSSGLFALDTADESPDLSVVRPIGIFAGEVKEFDLKTNELSGEKFYWFLVETLGGEVDVVCDPKWITIEPSIGNIIHGQFWLSGRLLD